MKMIPINFSWSRHTLFHFFEEKVKLSDYLKLDDMIVYYYFQQWQEEKDDILADLCYRFINRHLFKYVEYNPDPQINAGMELYQLFKKSGY